jgi:predicted DNA-binding mobile mystery protein A
MTTRQWAQRAGVSQPTVTAWERSEQRDRITLGKLREAAAALDCELVYALIPKAPLEVRVQQRALAKANALLDRAQHTMDLEAQGVREADLAYERDRLKDDLMRSRLSRLWDGE